MITYNNDASEKVQCKMAIAEMKRFSWCIIALRRYTFSKIYEAREKMARRTMMFGLLYTERDIHNSLNEVTPFSI